MIWNDLAGIFEIFFLAAKGRIEVCVKKMANETFEKLPPYKRMSRIDRHNILVDETAISRNRTNQHKVEERVANALLVDRLLVFYKPL